MKRPKANAPLTRQQVALHEAGHAVMAILTGCLIDSAELLDDGESGVTVIGQIGTEDPLVAGLVAWGGSVATCVEWIGEDDAAPFDRFGFGHQSIVTMRQWCEGMLAQFKPAVVAIGETLDARGRLSGSAIRRVAFAACPEMRAAAPTLPRGSVKAFREAMAAAS